MTPADLHTIRKRLGWTQAEAARRLGMSHRAYKYIEQELGARPERPEIRASVAVAMLAFALAADIAAAAVGPKRLTDFCRAVEREG